VAALTEGLHHIKVAQEQCRKRWISLPDPDLAYLVEGDREFWGYIRDLRWAQHFALLNRREMMHRVARCLEACIGSDLDPLCEQIECHHNYTEKKKVVLSHVQRHPGQW
jgi:tRNA-splicing ligase RtcB (3'-phosphate/5'-hydroxy nucleic acid ligase)